MSLIDERTGVVDNVLVRYDRFVRAALDRVGAASRNGEFGPGYQLPAASPALTDFFAASELAFADLGTYRGRRLTLLDLMRNPRTRTTKTFPSLVIVARAVRHIHATGERVMIVSPSSGNKATALRDAVLRASESGLVATDQLRILTVLPTSSQAKFWASPLSEQPALRRRNPVVTHDSARRDGVKALARSFVDCHGAMFWEKHGVRLWHTLDLDNYRVADVVRACAEDEFLPPRGGERLHAHAVSSAFGLLGHHLGTTLLAEAGHARPAPRYFLVQHLDTPDMVLSLYHGSPSRDHIPAYQYDERAGLYRQDADPRFPAATADVNELLEPTFYTRGPATSAEMNRLINEHGGGGIVVSRHECVNRYPEIRQLLAATSVRLPVNPAQLREWSLVMALTGILTAIDRGLIAEDDIVVHGSGSYQVADFRPIPSEHLRPVRDVAELLAVATETVAHEGGAR